MSGVTLKETAAASIPTPTTDKKTLFVDTDGSFKYKDDAGTVALLTGAPIDAQYLVLQLSNTLSGERVATAGTGISITDAGANSTATFAVNGSVVAFLAGTNPFTKNQRVTPVQLTDDTTIAVDASLSNNFYVTLGGNRTLANPTNLADGTVLNIVIKQDGDGGRTLSFDTKYAFPDGADTTLSTGSNAIDMLSCYYDAAADKLLCVLNKDFS